MSIELRKSKKARRSSTSSRIVERSGAFPVVGFGQLFEALFDVVVKDGLLSLVDELQLLPAESPREELLEIEFARIAAVENIAVHLDRRQRGTDLTQQGADFTGFAALSGSLFPLRGEV